MADTLTYFRSNDQHIPLIELTHPSYLDAPKIAH